MRLALAVLAVAVLALLSRPAAAGGGPETTVVVVNADSPVSLRVANEYVRLRDVPASHVVAVRGLSSVGVIGVDEFRERILAPIDAFLAQPGFGDRIDTIAYSADLPYAVDWRADEAKAPDPPYTPLASITSMTYCANRVRRKDAAAYLDLEGNGYYRRGGDEGGARQGSRAFSARVAWTGEDDPDPAPPADAPTRFRLAVSLAYTGPWGNSLPEVLSYLASAANADGTRPDGTVYLLKNGDVRAKTREPRFDACIEELRDLGRRAQVLSAGDAGQDGVLPKGRADVIGAVAGIAAFDWAASGSRLLPGALAEHLTSFGAVFTHGSQTKCTAFLRAGAAGTCGTVFEPYSIPHKFPSPRLHVHYAAGCSFAEALYQSVRGPYQLLALGDPLARPFARFAKVVVPPGPAPAASGTAVLVPEVTPAEGTRVARVELWVDGRYVTEGAPGAPLDLDTRAFANGPREVRVVAVEDSPIATRSHATATWLFGNGRAGGGGTAVSPTTTTLDGEVVASGAAPGATEAVVLAAGSVVARTAVSGGRFRVTVPAAALGLGVARVRVRATGAGVPDAESAPIEVTVHAPAARKASAPPRGGGGGDKRKPPDRRKAGTEAGLRATVIDAARKTTTVVLTSLGGPGGQEVAKALGAKAKAPVKHAEIEGHVEVAVAGLYEFVVRSGGPLTLDVGGARVVSRAEDAPPGVVFGVVALEAGWHEISLVLDTAASLDTEVLLGGEVVAAPLAGASLRHATR